MKKSYKVSITFIIFGIVSFISSIIGSMNSYVRPDGLLVEPFGLIVMGTIFGFIFITLGIVVGFSFSVWSLFHNPKKADTWVFGIITFIFIVCASYLTISKFYLTTQANKKISQNLGLTTPSRESFEKCRWKKVIGAGLELWGQSCDFGDKKLEVNTSETLPGVFLEDVTSGSPVAINQLIQVFELKNKSINSVIPLLADNEKWKVSDKCAFTKISNTRNNVTRYTLMPTGDTLKKFESDSKNEPIPDTCAGYGIGNSGTRYFEVYASNPNKVLFINIGQEMPMFDENTIVVK
jgi:hypothetical protein